MLLFKKSLKKLTVLLIASFLITSCSDDDTVESDAKPEPSTQNEYSFFVAGHVYGAPGIDNIGVHPPFRDKFDDIRNTENMEFGFFTGDFVIRSSTQNFDEVDDDVDSLGLPVYYVAGNHDVSDRMLYESRYGVTFYSFTHREDLFIVLDPNIDEWNISGSQLDFLKNTLDGFDSPDNNIFVFFHQLIWLDTTLYSNVGPNSYFDKADTTNFWKEVEPLFSSKSNEVYMFAGDVGAAGWSADFMYDNFRNITLVASGMGQMNGDNYVTVKVASNKEVDLELICIDGNEPNCFGDIEDYKISP